MKTATLKAAIELGFDALENGYESIEEMVDAATEFLNENLDKLETIEDECEVHGSGDRQTVSYNNYSSYGEIIQWGSELWNKPADFKIYHSDFLHVDEKTGKPYRMRLFQYVGQNEYNTDTYDVEFHDESNSNNKGFEYSLEDAIAYVNRYNGTNESYFEDYKGGIVRVVSNKTEEVVFEEAIKFKIDQEQDVYYTVYDKEDNDAVIAHYDSEDEAISFVNTENAAYGYKKFFYEIIEK